MSDSILVPSAPSAMQLANDPRPTETPKATYERLLDDIRGVDLRRRPELTAEVPTCLALAQLHLPAIHPHRERIAALVRPAACPVEQLEDSMQALAHAHSVCLSITRPTKELAELTKQGIALRDTLHLDVQSYELHGIVPRGSLRRYRGTDEPKVLSAELAMLAFLIEEHWTQLAGRTPITREHLDRAHRISYGLLVTFVACNGPQPVELMASRLRQQALHLFFHRYEEIRHALRFLRRREGDAERIAPQIDGMEVARTKKKRRGQ